ncbi:MAG: GNAT family N-acetyltransferase [Actinocrinis sp.]
MSTKQARVALEPMTLAEYGVYLDHSVRGYAEDKITSGEWAPDEALARSREDFDRLLPDGLKSADQYLFTAHDASSGEQAAILWVALRMKGGRLEAFIYDIEVREEARGKGYGRATMQAAIEKARELHADTLGLHVFGHNTVARSLYESLGFHPTNISMSLDL